MKNSLHPESLMMSYGYKPELSEGAVKAPLFQTSTFAFKTAEEGKSFFEVAYGLREKGENEELGLIYSRMNNPNLEIAENRLCLWDKADDCAVFESGMSAISTVLLEFLSPGDLLVCSAPTYGGTDHFITHFLSKIGIEVVFFHAYHDKDALIELIEATGKSNRIGCVYVETPANPTNEIIDIQMCGEVCATFSTDERKVGLVVDNTYMGPVWSAPLQLGADLVIYSATKYIGGHSDLIAGAVLGSIEYIKRVKTLRTFLGNMPSPHTCWLLLRSLETLKIRMEKQALNAKEVAAFLSSHKNVVGMHYLGSIKDPSQEAIFRKQYSSAGAMISFNIEGGEHEAFTFLNHLKLFKLAVSLGSTESLAQHPASMTHSGLSLETKVENGITDNLVRLSIGIEHADDLVADIRQALDVAVQPRPHDVVESEMV